MNLNITFDVLPFLAVAMSLIAYFVPQYQKLDERKKQLVMIAAIAAIVLVVVVGSLLDFWAIYAFTRWQDWIIYPFTDFAAGVLANFGTWGATNKILGKRKAAGDPLVA